MVRGDDSFRVLVAGLGNVLLGDDGAGVHAARILSGDPPDGSIVVDVGASVLDALPMMQQAEMVVAVDAVDIGREPGTVCRFDLQDAEFLRHAHSLHEVTLPVALQMLPEAKRPRVVVVGVQPRCLETGTELSEDVSAALPKLIEGVRQEVERYLAATAST